MEGQDNTTAPTRGHSRAYAAAQGLKVYDSRRCCRITAHGYVRRVSDNACTGCVQARKELKARITAKVKETMLDKLKARARKELEAEAKRKAAEELKEKKAADREAAKEARKRERVRLKTEATKAANKQAKAAAAQGPDMGTESAPWD